MAICEMHLSNSNVLGKMVSATIILPQGHAGPFPVFYLLHGLSDDHSAWSRLTSLERYVRDLPLIVVMPNGERGWYTNSISNPKAAYDTFLTQDLIGFVDATFQTIPTREGRAIAGLSMGGYGALATALRHPELFCAAVSHSGAVEIAALQLDDDTERQQELRSIFGATPAGGDNDLYALATKTASPHLPALRIDCGVDDFLIEHNRRFHMYLEENAVPHEYAEWPGAHDWEYWDLHIQETISFISRALGIGRDEALGHP